MSTKKMRILILGATGGIGLLLIREILASPSDAEIVVYARSPNKLPDDLSSHPSLTIVKGTLEDLETLDTAMVGTTIVLSALGPSVSQGPFHPSGCPLANAYKGILASMKAHDVNRLIALGTPSQPDPHDTFSAKFRALVTGVAVFARTAYKDMAAIGNVIRETGDRKSVV